MDTIASAIRHDHGNQDDPEYDAYLARVNRRFLANIEGGAPLFTIATGRMWGMYLSNFSSGQRQHHDCGACRRFIDNYGGLLTIAADGSMRSALWDEDDAPDLYKASARAMARYVSQESTVTEVFLSKDRVWGTPVTGIWRHLAITPPSEIIYRGAILTPGQAMAEKRQDFETVARALVEFPLVLVKQALTLLDTDTLYRSEKVRGPAQFLHDLHLDRAVAKGDRNKRNVLWRAIATAPAGFCHPRSSMIGTLLEDLASGMPFDDVARRFKAKMHPLQYQRPQAAPTAGNIATGEKIIEQLGAQASLRRRFARADELRAFWKPAAPAPEHSGPGVFGHLSPKGSAAAPGDVVQRDPTAITMEKFCRTVLEKVDAIEILVPSGNLNFLVFTTAVDPEAPPILQWDRPDRRNPFAHYVWHGGAPASQYGLSAGRYHRVTALVSKPAMWDAPNDYPHQAKAATFIIEGARESRANGGMAIFPETLRSELHGIRATIEAYSRSRNLEGVEDATGCGLVVSDQSGVTVRVRQGTVTLAYRIERWD